MPLKGLTNRTPSALVTGAGEGLAEATAEGVPKREGEAAVPPVPDELQAPASAATISTSAEACPGVLMNKGNDILRIGLRFRYDPAPEAGHRPSPPGLCSKGSRLRRMASGYPFCFIYSNWRNSRNLNLLEVASHLV